MLPDTRYLNQGEVGNSGRDYARHFLKWQRMRPDLFLHRTIQANEPYLTTKRIHLCQQFGINRNDGDIILANEIMG